MRWLASSQLFNEVKLDVQTLTAVLNVVVDGAYSGLIHFYSHKSVCVVNQGEGGSPVWIRAVVW